MWKAADVRGPWQEVGVAQTPSPADGYSDSNPAAILLPNGSLLMMWRGAGCACSGAAANATAGAGAAAQCPALAVPLPAACATNAHSCWQGRLHLARAGHWGDLGSYTFENASLFECGRAPNLAQRGSEDPYLWSKTHARPEAQVEAQAGGAAGGEGQESGAATPVVSFHAILHRNGCKGGVGCSPHVSGQHAYSVDGAHWSLSGASAYNATVQYADGTVDQLLSRERPHLILDPKSGAPTHLVTGASEPARGGGGGGSSSSGWADDHTVTHIQPIRTATAAG